jgi:NitT/TauT family transport system permease protein
MDKTKKRRIQILAASVFWLGVWQAAAVAIGQEVFLVSPVQAIGTLVELLPQAEFWKRIGFSAGRILLGFGLGVLSSAVLAVAAEKWEWVDALLAPVMQLVKATPVASFIILALVWVSGSSLSVLISFLMGREGRPPTPTFRRLPPAPRWTERPARSPTGCARR